MQEGCVFVLFCFSTWWLMHMQHRNTASLFKKKKKEFRLWNKNYHVSLLHFTLCKMSLIKYSRARRSLDMKTFVNHWFFYGESRDISHLWSVLNQFPGWPLSEMAQFILLIIQHVSHWWPCSTSVVLCMCVLTWTCECSWAVPCPMLYISMTSICWM